MENISHIMVLQKTNVIKYSEDGINWSLGPTSATQSSVLELAFGNNKFTTYTCEIPLNSLSIYTKDEQPTLDSLLYSKPNVESSMKITSIAESSITCSDNNVYNRNPKDDVES